MTSFIATPVGTAAPFAPVDVTPATGANPVTVMQVGIPAANFLWVRGWGVDIAGVSGTDVPFYAHLIETDVAATTGTALTPTSWDQPGGQASAMVGGTAATCYGPTVEGTIAAARLLSSHRVHPQTGYSEWFPTDAGGNPMCGLVASARYLRIRVRAITTAYAVIPWLVWRE